jgi:hypothetical protein
MMTKKDFIALADEIRAVNTNACVPYHFTTCHLDVLADFCKSRNPSFDRERWLGYIRGECGPNGGKVK